MVAVFLITADCFYYYISSPLYFTLHRLRTQLFLLLPTDFTVTLSCPFDSPYIREGLFFLLLLTFFIFTPVLLLISLYMGWEFTNIYCSPLLLLLLHHCRLSHYIQAKVSFILIATHRLYYYFVTAFYLTLHTSTFQCFLLLPTVSTTNPALLFISLCIGWEISFSCWPQTLLLLYHYLSSNYTPTMVSFILIAFHPFYCYSSLLFISYYIGQFFSFFLLLHISLLLLQHSRLIDSTWDENLAYYCYPLTLLLLHHFLLFHSTLAKTSDFFITPIVFTISLGTLSISLDISWEFSFHIVAHWLYTYSIISFYFTQHRQIFHLFFLQSLSLLLRYHLVVSHSI